MKKKSSKKWIWIPVIFVFLVLIGGVTYFTTKDTPQSIAGFSTLSLTQAELRSDSSYLNGKVWMLTVRQGGLSQSAEGTFTPDDINSKTSGDTTTTKNFKISIDYDDQQCVYPIQSTNSLKPLYKLTYTTWYYNLLTAKCTEAEAGERGISNGLYIGQTSGALSKCFVVYWDEQTPVGNFGKTDIRSSMTVNVDAGSRSGSKNLDTESSIQGPISDFAYVIWNGNLDTGKPCYGTTDMIYRPAYYNGVWRIISKQKYEDYLSRLNAYGSYSDIDALTSWIDSVNTKRTSALVSQSFGTIDSSTSLNNAVVRNDITSALQYPVLTLYVKADTLGIYTPTPEISLKSSDSDCFKTGEEGIIKVVAKNKGNEAGTWNFYATCNNPFTVTESREYSISAGSEKTITLPLSASASKKETSTCEVYAESPAGVESITVGVCVDPQQTCQANKKFCSTSNGLDVVKKCSSDGATSTIEETCNSKQTCVDAECVDDDGGDGDGLGLWDKFKKWINDYFTPLKIASGILLGLIVGIVSFIFANNFIENKNKSKKGLIWIPIILSIVVAVVVGFVAYYYFWLGVIILVVVSIITFIVKRFLPFA